jgi:hypothetical protein
LPPGSPVVVSSPSSDSAGIGGWSNAPSLGCFATSAWGCATTAANSR